MQRDRRRVPRRLRTFGPRTQRGQRALVVVLIAVYGFSFRGGAVLWRSKHAKSLAASGAQRLSFFSLAVVLLDTYPRLLPLLSTRLKDVMQTG